MATYFIVANGTFPLGANEIEAGTTIDVVDGDIFIVQSTADANINFQAASGETAPVDFDVNFNTSGAGGSFDVTFDSDLSPDINVATNVDISSIDLIATDADDTTITLNDGASIKSFAGSSSGTDDVTIGDGVTVSNSFNTSGGADVINMGSNNTFSSSFNTGSGADTINLYDDNVFNGVVNLGGGDDTLYGGASNDFDNAFYSGNGEDTLDFGADNYFNYLELGDEADSLDVGYIDSSLSQTIDGVSHEFGSVDDVLEINTSHDAAGFITALQNSGYTLQGDGSWTANGSNYHISWNNVDINDFERIIVCFVRGTHIETQNGGIAIEDLRSGDMVKTLDHGYQPIRWVGSTSVPAYGNLAPYRIRKDTLGNKRDLLVSPQHRMMLSGWQLELLFDETEVLATAKSLQNDCTITRQEGGTVEYFHMLFDTHEIVFAEGAPSESFHPGEQGMDAISEQSRDEIYRLFPELEFDLQAYGEVARRSLKSYETTLALEELKLDVA